VVVGVDILCCACGTPPLLVTRAYALRDMAFFNKRITLPLSFITLLTLVALRCG
jgi:hypothetical protein